MIYRFLCEKDVGEIEKTWHNFSDRWSEKQMLSSFNSGRFVVIGAFNVDALVGVICCSTAIPESDLELIFVHEDYRRQGVAHTLMEKAFDALKDKGVCDMFLEVRESNIPAISLYKKRNFGVISKRNKYYHDGENALVMIKELV